VLVTLMARTLGISPERAIAPLVALLDEPPGEPITAIRRGKRFPLDIGARDHADAERLHDVTGRLSQG
jgi:hypothetical protein